MKQDYKFLQDINFPSDLRKLSESKLQELSNEVRREMIDAVSETGGHLGAGLGVVELTVALHYIFDTPNDKLICHWGCQIYNGERQLTLQHLAPLLDDHLFLKQHQSSLF